jgi:hypothetical protein
MQAKCKTQNTKRNANRSEHGPWNLSIQPGKSPAAGDRLSGFLAASAWGLGADQVTGVNLAGFGAGGSQCVAAGCCATPGFSEGEAGVGLRTNATAKAASKTQGKRAHMKR